MLKKISKTPTGCRSGHSFEIIVFHKVHPDKKKYNNDSRGHVFHAEGPSFNRWFLQVGLGKTIAWNPGKLLPISVDGAQLNDGLLCL